MAERSSRLAKLRSLLLNAGIVVIVFSVASAFQSRNMLDADGEAAPPLRGVTLDGEVYGLAGVSGRPALIYFFAPWCKICGASAGNLNRLHRWRGPDDFEVVAVALDWASAEEVRAYVERHEFDMPVLLGDSNFRGQWQIYAYPSYYVLDSEHRIARRDVGYSSQLGLLWRAWTVD